MTHDEAQELLGAYALDAVEPDEAEAIELHLRSCPHCRSEVEAHRETASWLAHGGSAAPDGVWERIAGSLEEAPPPIDVARILPWETRERHSSRPGPRRRVARWLAGVAAALVLVLGGVAVNQQRQIDRLETRGAMEAALTSALRDPGARQVSLQSAAGPPVSLKAVLLPDGSGYLVADPLQRLDTTHTYQLWGINDATVVSLGVLGNAPGIVAFHASTDVRTLAVTAEADRRGVAAPRSAPVVAGQVPRTA
jgi:hypothetical protein